MCTLVYHRTSIPQASTQRNQRERTTCNQSECLQGAREGDQDDRYPVPTTYLSGRQVGEDEQTSNKRIQH